jgi:uncharacterized membrane protein
MTRLAPLLLALIPCLAAACQPASRGATGTLEDIAEANSEYRWQCGEMIVSTRLAEGRLELDRPGTRHVLEAQNVASGASHADGNGNAFWSKGDEATLALAGEEPRGCTRTERGSPWDEARERGVALRAGGNEPGWVVEVDPGERPAMRAVLDYGERRLEVPAARPLPAHDSVAGFGGEASDGTPVELRIRHVPCRDDMSGHPFPSTAELMVATRVYRGCAAYLVP